MSKRDIGLKDKNYLYLKGDKWLISGGNLKISESLVV